MAHRGSPPRQTVAWIVLGVVEGVIPRKDRDLPAPRKYPDEREERSERLRLDVLADPGRANGCFHRVGDKRGINAETLRTWALPGPDRHPPAGRDHHGRRREDPGPGEGGRWVGAGGGILRRASASFAQAGARAAGSRPCDLHPGTSKGVRAPAGSAGCCAPSIMEAVISSFALSSPRFCGGLFIWFQLGCVS